MCRSMLAPGRCREGAPDPLILPRPPAALGAVRRPLGWFLHDQRGATAALQGYLALFRAGPGSLLDDEGRELVAGMSACADRLARHVDLLALLLEAGARRLVPLAETVRDVTGGLQEFLSRTRVTLNLPGDLPDREMDGRALAVAVGALVTGLAGELADAGGGRIDLTARDGREEMLLTLRATTDDERPARDGLAARLAQGVGGLALRAALDSLGARLEMARSPGELGLDLRLPASPAGEAVA